MAPVLVLVLTWVEMEVDMSIDKDRIYIVCSGCKRADLDITDVEVGDQVDCPCGYIYIFTDSITEIKEYLESKPGYFTEWRRV